MFEVDICYFYIFSSVDVLEGVLGLQPFCANFRILVSMNFHGIPSCHMASFNLYFIKIPLLFPLLLIIFLLVHLLGHKGSIEFNLRFTLILNMVVFELS